MDSSSEGTLLVIGEQGLWGFVRYIYRSPQEVCRCVCVRVCVCVCVCVCVLSVWGGVVCVVCVCGCGVCGWVCGVWCVWVCGVWVCVGLCVCARCWAYMNPQVK